MDIDAMGIAAHFGVLPSAMMRDWRLIPVASDGERVVILTDQTLEVAHAEDVAFALSRPPVFHRVDSSPAFEEALAFALTHAGIAPGTQWTMGCDARFRQRCPLNWFSLQTTTQSGVRHCQICAREVHLARDAADARRLATAGHCAAWAETAAEADYLLGDIDTNAEPTNEVDPWS
jgi:hypothetical protein